MRIVNSVQGWHNFFINKEDIYIETFPMKKERQEMYCIRTIYDIDSDNWNHISIDPSKRLVKKSRLNGGINFEQSIDSIRTLLNLRFNEHDCYHRASCFKKGCECRAKLPMLLWPLISIQ